jgi:hypothetical protein
LPNDSLLGQTRAEKGSRRLGMPERAFDALPRDVALLRSQRLRRLDPQRTPRRNDAREQTNAHRETRKGDGVMQSASSSIVLAWTPVCSRQGMKELGTSARHGHEKKPARSGPSS